MTESQVTFTQGLVKAFGKKQIAPGRTHLHKTAFFVKDEIGKAVPFKFVLHHYGPYSFELDETIQGLADAGYVSVSKAPSGYSATYTAAPRGMKRAKDVNARAKSAIKKWVESLATFPVRRLELYATALYVMRRHNGADQEEDVQAVKRIKPHFSDDEISAAFDWLREQKLKGLG